MKLSEFMQHPLDLAQSWFTATLPRILPEGWQEVKAPKLGNSKVPARAYHHAAGLTVLITGDKEQDGRRWITATLACTDRAPALVEIMAVKNLFIGGEHAAVLRLPKVNEKAHPFVVHLFRCYDADEMSPDFTTRTKEAARKVAQLR